MSRPMTQLVPKNNTKSEQSVPKPGTTCSGFRNNKKTRKPASVLRLTHFCTVGPFFNSKKDRAGRPQVHRTGQVERPAGQLVNLPPFVLWTLWAGHPQEERPEVNKNAPRCWLAPAGGNPPPFVRYRSAATQIVGAGVGKAALNGRLKDKIKGATLRYVFDPLSRF